MIKYQFFSLLIGCLSFCYQSMAQYDTIYRNIKELRVEQKSFLRSLKSASQKKYFCNIGEDVINTIELIEVQDNCSIFMVGQYPLYKLILKQSKGYFEIDGVYYFVLGSDSLSEYPQGLFAFTNNQKAFLDLVPQDRWCTLGSDGCCELIFEYRKKKLFFIKNVTYGGY